MFKFVKYNKVKVGTVTKQFVEKNDDVVVNHFDVDVVSISADSESLLNSLIASQDAEINCVEITKEEFKVLVSNSSQVKRINDVLSKKIAKDLEAIKAKYSQEERETWTKQESEAKAFKISNNEADAPFLSILAAGAGVSVDAFADLVLANSLEFITLSATALRDKQTLQSEMMSEIGL